MKGLKYSEIGNHLGSSFFLWFPSIIVINLFFMMEKICFYNCIQNDIPVKTSVSGLNALPACQPRFYPNLFDLQAL